MICLVLTIFAHIFPSAWTGINERTFLAIKPDGYQRRLVGEIIRRFEKKGFCLVALKIMQASEKLLRQHYIALQDKPFYDRLVKYMGSGPVVAMVSITRNVIHGSDSRESAQREIALWFQPDELVCWQDSAERWIYE
ncbi:hypothetical protein XELAEV_18047686mg [Xenopus laevis]|uniref:nucleoside-diphosphate kinase n=1 Tax=Xenopus laevis TaxID=8355 RepID=A0A974BVM9_XENLA|nr:hypothetical protein XELAEV_18047686mg [Xenopus laevis]